MPLFSVFVTDRADPAPEIIPERFSWGAALFAPLWALVHGMWLETLGWFLVTVGIIAGAKGYGPDAAMWLYVLFAVWIGFSAADLRAAARARKGQARAADIVAPNRERAEVEWFAQSTDTDRTAR